MPMLYIIEGRQKDIRIERITSKRVVINHSLLQLLLHIPLLFFIIFWLFSLFILVILVIFIIIFLLKLNTCTVMLYICAFKFKLPAGDVQRE